MAEEYVDVRNQLRLLPYIGKGQWAMGKEYEAGGL